MEKRHTIIVFSSWLVPEMLLCPGLRWECNEWTVVPLGKKKRHQKSTEKRWAQQEIGNQIVYLEMVKRIVYSVLGQKRF